MGFWAHSCAMKAQYTHCAHSIAFAMRCRAEKSNFWTQNVIFLRSRNRLIYEDGMGRGTLEIYEGGKSLLFPCPLGNTEAVPSSTASTF